MVVTSIAVVLGCTLIVMYFQTKTAQIIPNSIQQHVAFQIYGTSSSNNKWTISKGSVSYNNSNGVLSITVIGDNNSFAISEQQTPSVFTDVPQYYPTLLSKLNIYSEVQNGLGTIELTKPSELDGTQTAVLNSGGTLMFVRPKYNLSNSQWNSFFNSLVVIK